VEEPPYQLRRRVLRLPKIKTLVARGGGGGGAFALPKLVAGLAPNPVALRGGGAVVYLDDVVAGGHCGVAVRFLVEENRQLLVVGIVVSGAGKPF